MQFVFIIGCQRSGTTLTGQILGAHPNAFLVDEDDGLYAALDRWRSRELTLSEAMATCYKKAADKYASASRRDNGLPGQNNAVTHVILKAPNATFFLEDFLSRYDEETMHFVFPVRDARDVVASMARLAHMRMVERQTEKLLGSSNSLGLSAKMLAELQSVNTSETQKRALIWALKTGLYCQYASSPLNALWFRYEDFVADSEHWQRKLLTHVGLDWQSAPEDHAKIYTGVGPGWTFRNRSVDSQSTARWKNRLSEEEAAQVWDIAASTMADLGYQQAIPEPDEAVRELSSEFLNAPIIATGRGGSGTRLLSTMLLELGVFLGNSLNASEDSIEWADLLYEIGLGRLQGRSHPGWPQELRDRARAVLGRSTSDPKQWGWKLPETMLALEECAQAFPKARLIHLVRHPVDLSLRRSHVTSRRGHVIGTNVLKASYKYLGWKPEQVTTDPDYRLNMASWRYQVDRASDFGRRLPEECYLELQYEAICRDPQKVSDQLADFLGVARVKTRVKAKLDTGRLYQWRWPDPRAEEVWQTCGEVATRLGYTPPETLAADRRLEQKSLRTAPHGRGPVLFVVGAALGHIGRCLTVAEQLAKRGHSVHFVGSDPHGFFDSLVRPYFSCECFPDLRQNPGDFATLLENRVSTLQPSCIVIDTNPKHIATWKRPTIPVVYLTNAFLTRLGKAGIIQDAEFDKKKGHWNAVREAKGLPPLKSSRELFEATKVLLCDPPVLRDDDSPLPENYEWVGPCSWQPSNMALPASLQEAQQVFFISLGSTGLRDVPEGIVRSIQEKLQPQSTVALHAHAEINMAGVNTHNRLPAGDVLKRSMLTLTHGGTGSTYQALQLGVPAVILPKHLNHKRLGELLQERGLAILLDANAPEKGIEQLIKQWESLSQRVREQAANPWMQYGPTRAAAAIESLLAEKPDLNKAIQGAGCTLNTSEQDLKARLEAAYLANQDLQNQLQALWASRSWRVTRPLRAVLGWLIRQ